jgi:long-chain acyl-CoA synthetase
VDAFRAGLGGLGVGSGDRVGIISNNRVEWAVACYATHGLGASFVPMYEAQQADEWKFILQDCDAKVCIGATDAIVAELERIKGELPQLTHVVGLDLPESDERSYRALLRRGRAAPRPTAAVQAKDIAGLIYTAGTTGKPKGVVLSHGNLASNVSAIHELFTIGRGDRTLAFLPWAHSFGQTGELHMVLSMGASIAINDEIPNLVSNLAEVKPTILVAVPRIFNRIYDGVNRQMTEKPKMIQGLFAAGIRIATERSRGRDSSLLEGIQLALADKLIFSKVRAKFGGRLKFVISGSAALSKDVAEFIDALGIEVYEGYGLTETSPVATVNYPGHRKIGSVGKAIPGVRIRIDTQTNGDATKGEILIYGPNVMQGYHNRPDENAKVLLPDGGFRSGDMGHLDDEGYLYITGRIKEQYKLETGKYVVPAPLEEELKLSPYVLNAMIYGDNKPHNVVLLVVDEEAVRRWGREHQVEIGDVSKNARVRQLFREELEHRARAFKSYEKPKDFLLVTEDFTVDNDMLTPKLSLKRRNVLAKYESALLSLY